MRNISFAISVALLSSVLIAQPPGRERCDCSQSLSPGDITAIKAVIEAYRTAWLEDDAAGVQRTLTDSSVLLPPHASAPVVGMKKIQEFWWPQKGPTTKVLQLDISVDQIEGNGCLAFARGTDTVGWSTSEAGKVTKTRHKGRYLNAMKKMADGSWRILQHMWDDQANESF